MKYDSSVYKALTYLSQFGINMLVPLFICSAAGWLLDEKLGTSVFFILLFFVGAAAGFRNIFILAKHMDSREKGDRLSAYESRKDRRDS